MTLVSPAVAAKLTVPPAEAVEPLPPGTETRPLSFTKLVARLNRGQTWGQVQIGVMCLPAGNMTWRGGQSQVDTGELDVVFFEEIEKAGFSSTGNPNLLFEREDNSQAEYLVAGAIKSASARLCYKLAGFGDYDTVNGEVIFEVEWQIYSRINKTVVAQITTRGGALRKESASGGANVLFDIAFSENVKQLINKKEFRDVFIGSTIKANELRRPNDYPALQIKTRNAVSSATKIDDISGSVVSIGAGDGHGSGFLISDDGLFLTNAHVVGQAKIVRVRWSDKLETVGEVVRIDRARDVALVKSESRQRAPLSLRQDRLELGSPVRAIGAPYMEELQGTVTAGIVSSDRIVDGFRYIQSDVAVNPGNSGGPLIDSNGNVVALTVSGLSVSGANVGINFFIPIDEALRFLQIKALQ